MHTLDVQLSLGPIPYFWPAPEVHAFYAAIANSPVDIVYLGETVCAKRRQLRSQDWRDIAERLRAAGKQVLFSSLTLIEADSELRALQRLCAEADGWIEANDMAAVQARAGRPFVGGATLNLYNQHSLRRLHAAGMRRWVAPFELSGAALADLQRLRPDGLQTEVLVHGRIPLAYSARCFTARAYDRPKDDCQYRCLDHPDGMLVETREDQAFLCLNGIQTQSALSQNLLWQLPSLAEMGVEVLRISPQAQHTPAIIELFDRCRRGELSLQNGHARLATLAPTGHCDGYWFGEAGLSRWACGT